MPYRLFDTPEQLSNNFLNGNKRSWTDEELDKAIEEHNLLNIAPDFRDAILNRLAIRINQKK